MTPNESVSVTSFSQNSKKLRIDFYESGRGDTIIVTFPEGGKALIDAHPSTSQLRPEILDLVKGSKLHFVCLTHPHADHGVDLVPVLNSEIEIEEFWHTNSDIAAFIFRLQEMPSWSAEVAPFALKMAKGWADFLIDLYATVIERNIPIHQVRAGEEIHTIDGVEVHVLAPEESEINNFARYWIEKAGDISAKRPDPNRLSAILALKWGDGVVLLGADAGGLSWQNADVRFRKLNLPKAVILKVPHHGSGDTLPPNERTFMDLCRHDDKKCQSVLFAGDAKHPHPRVEEVLRRRTDLYCLGNGIRGKVLSNDLGIELEGAVPVGTFEPCQPVVSFEISHSGEVSVLAGHSCEACKFCAE